MEFAPCKSGVREIRHLKDNAKALGRAKGIALHKSLDVIAEEEGFPGGWHDLVTSRWTLDTSMQMHKLDLIRQVALTIIFDRIDDPVVLDGAKGMDAKINRDIFGGKPRDTITFWALETGSGIINADWQSLFEDALVEKKLRSRCKLCISLAEPILQDPSIAQTVVMRATPERLIHDMKSDQALIGQTPMHAGKFPDAPVAIAYEAFPSRISVKKVILIYVVDQTAGLLEIERDDWLDVMTDTVTHIGDPRTSRSACITLLQKLGADIQIDTTINEQRQDGLEEGP